MSAVEIQVVLPPRSQDPLSDMLRYITAEIEKATGEDGAWGLGGQSGYGAPWDSAVFMMRRFCWCELETCAWCSEDACGCENPEPEHYLDGERIADWCSANRSIVAPMPSDVAKYGTPAYEEADRIFYASIAERDRRLVTIFPERIHTCEPRGMMENRPRGKSNEPNQSAPNFWHKPSGFKVWWYKYIGRGMEAVNQPADLTSVFNDCLRDIALAAATGTAKTAKPVEAEGSQSGPKGNAQ